MKILALFFLLASSAFGQVQLGGPIYVPSTSAASLGQTNVVFTADGDCNLLTPVNCTVSGGAAGPYYGTLNVTSTATLTAQRNVIVPSSPGRCYDTFNHTNGAQSIQVTDTSLVGVVVGSGNTVVRACTNGSGYVQVGASGGVSQIIAGTNVTVSPIGGTGVVTVNATGGGSSVTPYSLATTEANQFWRPHYSINFGRASVQYASQSPTSIVIIGDSTQCCIGPSNTVNNPIAQLRKVAARYGTRGTGIIPVGGNTGTALRPEWTATGSLATVSDFGPFQSGTTIDFNSMFQINTGTVLTLSGQSGTSITLVGELKSGGTGCLVSTDGTATGTVGVYSSGASSVYSTNLTLPAGGPHTFTVQPASTGPCYLYGADVIQSNVGVEIHNLAHGGALSSAYGGNTATQIMPILQTLSPAPTMFEIGLGINNALFTSGTVSQYSTDITAIISAIRTAFPFASIILTDENLVNGGSSGSITQAQIKAAEQTIATANNTAYISISDSWGSVATSFNAGLLSSDQIHPSDLGGVSYGQILADTIFPNGPVVGPLPLNATTINATGSVTVSPANFGATAPVQFGFNYGGNANVSTMFNGQGIAINSCGSCSTLFASYTPLILSGDTQNANFSTTTTGGGSGVNVQASQVADVALLVSGTSGQTGDLIAVQPTVGATNVFRVTAAGDMLLNTTGSTTATPRQMGVASLATNSAFRIPFGVEGGIQTGNALNTQIYGYSGIDFLTGAQSLTPPSFTGGTSGAYVARFLPSAATVGVLVQAASSPTANLAEFRSSSNALLAAVSGSGDVLVNTTGSTTTTPRQIGVASLATNSAFRIPFGVEGGIQTGNALNTQIYGYSGIDFLTGAQSTSPPSFTGGTAGAYVARLLPQAATVGLLVQAASSPTANLAEFRSSTNALLAGVSATGAISSATLVSGNCLQGATGGTVASTSAPCNSGVPSTNPTGGQNNYAATDSVCQSNGTGCPAGFGGGTTATATPAANVASVTCITATCTSYRGTYSISTSSGFAGPATLFSLTWAATSTPLVCMVSSSSASNPQNFYHSVATTTGMTISTGTSSDPSAQTMQLDYSCRQ